MEWDIKDPVVVGGGPAEDRKGKRGRGEGGKEYWYGLQGGQVEEGGKEEYQTGGNISGKGVPRLVRRCQSETDYQMENIRWEKSHGDCQMVTVREAI